MTWGQHKKRLTWFDSALKRHILFHLKTLSTYLTKCDHLQHFHNRTKPTLETHPSTTLGFHPSSQLNHPFPYQGNHPTEPEPSNQEVQAALVREHDWYISFTLCSGCTLSPSCFTLPRCLAGSHYKAFTKLLFPPLCIHWGFTDLGPFLCHQTLHNAQKWAANKLARARAIFSSWLRGYVGLLVHEPVLRIQAGTSTIHSTNSNIHQKTFTKFWQHTITITSHPVRFLVTMLLKHYHSHVA
jgi:hypothetical protein